MSYLCDAEGKDDPFGEQNKQIYVIDSQILNTTQDCSRKANYTFGMNLEPVLKPDYFEKGDLMHQVLAEYYNLRGQRQQWESWNWKHKDVIQRCCKVGQEASVKMNLDANVVDEVLRTCTEYLEYTENDGWDRIVAVEEVASKILYEDEKRIFLYQGKLDLVIELSNCPILPIDHKSASRRGTPNFLSNQFQGYCWLLDVNTIVINKIGFQKTLKPQEKFERHVLSYPKELLNEWQENTIYWIKKYIKDSEENHFAPNYTSCDKYSGCIFQKVCGSTADSRKYKLTQLFNEREKVWDVGQD